jgi:DNA polymerase-4
MDVDDLLMLESTLRNLAQRATKNLRENGLLCRTVQLKLRYANFETISRSHTLPQASDLDEPLVREVVELFRQAYDRERKVRLLGAGLSSLMERTGQLELFSDEQPSRASRLTASLDRIRDKLGFSAISLGTPAHLEQRDWRKEDLDVLAKRTCTPKGE